MKGMRALREMLQQEISLNGGYHTGRDGNYLLSWNVAVYGGMSVKEMQGALCQGDSFESPADLRLRYPDWETSWETFSSAGGNWEHVVEDMRSQLCDGDTFRLWRPAIATRFGFSYTGLGADRPFDVDFTFLGRSGKHLCIERFNGRRLTEDEFPSPGDVRKRFRFDFGDEEELNTNSSEWTRQLLGMIQEWDLCFDRKAVNKEALYQTAFQFAQYLEGTA